MPATLFLIGTSVAHTIPMAVMVQEETVVIAEAEKAVLSAANPAIYGSNGEKVLLNFLRKYLPSCFRLSTGHVLHPDGVLSPQIDLMLLDARFPPLAVNADGTTTEMLEAVLGVTSVKKLLDKSEIEEQERYASRIFGFFRKPYPAEEDGFETKVLYPPIFYVIGYRCAIREATVLRHLDSVQGLRNPLFTIFCMRMPEADQSRGMGPGCIFRYDGIEPDVALFSVFSTSPLSDFYYMMLQDAYGMMDPRAVNHEDIRLFMMRYYHYGRRDPGAGSEAAAQ